MYESLGGQHLIVAAIPEEEEAVFIRDSVTNEGKRWCLHVKIEGDPLNTQHAQHRPGRGSLGSILQYFSTFTRHICFYFSRKSGEISDKSQGL